MFVYEGNEPRIHVIYFLTLIGRVEMTVFLRSSFMRRHCINVTRISDVNERHRDALRRGMDD